MAEEEIKRICNQSEKRTQFFSYGGNGYKDSVRHFFDSSSAVASAAVQPGNVDDLSEIMKVLAKRNAKFAIKGGGHASNPSFSSTDGIQIYMSRFNKISYDPTTKTIEVGAGCLWNQVYLETAKVGRNVVGGSGSHGVGVAGFLLGGGYSLKTNQYGLGIDNIAAFQIVLPTGEIVVAREGDSQNRRLFEAVKGGGNNFGIVTQFTLKTHPQGTLYGGIPTFSGLSDIEKAKAAIVDFVKNERRPKAVIVAAFRHTLVQGRLQNELTVGCVFDGRKPSPSEDPFKRFSNIRSQANLRPNLAVCGQTETDQACIKATSGGGAQYANVLQEKAVRVEDEFQEMSYATLDDIVSHAYDRTPLQDSELGLFTEAEKSGFTYNNTRKARNNVELGKPGTPGVAQLNARGRFGCIMVSNYTQRLVDTIATEAEKSAARMKEYKGELVKIDVWPFLPTIFDKSLPAAWPHEKGKAFGPVLAYYQWKDAKDDKYWVDEMKRALTEIRKVALEEGCTTRNAPVYGNTSLEDTPVKDIYRGNLKNLSAIRAMYDPNNVMGNAGGFRIPLSGAS
jgi:FAD/FMN-containing dehydrogenase